MHVSILDLSEMAFLRDVHHDDEIAGDDGHHSKMSKHASNVLSIHHVEVYRVKRVPVLSKRVLHSIKRVDHVFRLDRESMHLAI